MPDRAGADSLTARPVARVVLRKRLNEALSGGVPVLAVVPFTTNSRVAAGKRWDSAAQFGPSARFENRGGAPSLSLRCGPICPIGFHRLIQRVGEAAVTFALSLA